jgi:hypothetical protein
MPELSFPPKAELDAETDEAFGHARNLRATLIAKDGKAGAWMTETADAVAAYLRAQFPDGSMIARAAMAVTQALYAVDDEAGGGLSAGGLLAVAALAAERLNQGEATGRG